MKVVLVNHDKRWGGGQEFIRTLGVDLVRRGIALSVLCRQGSPSAELFSAAGLAVNPVPLGVAGVFGAGEI